ncbi:MAG TPA: hypothetical protein VFL13_06940 [Candidatus Baltobacteraceae bacterium]|nr:hypothetical protein [Candidatus Baltobacteraceae bacterium]
MNSFSALAVLAAFCTGVLFLLASPGGAGRPERAAPADPAAVPLIGPPRDWTE